MFTPVLESCVRVYPCIGKLCVYPGVESCVSVFNLPVGLPSAGNLCFYLLESSVRELCYPVLESRGTQC